MGNYTDKYDKLKPSIIDIESDDYGLVIHNISDQGLGLRIKAGDHKYSNQKSLAILSVADRNNDNKLVVKASGEVVVFHQFDANEIVTNHISHNPVNSYDLPVKARPGQVMYCSDIKAMCFYDGLKWQKIASERLDGN